MRRQAVFSNVASLTKTLTLFLFRGLYGQIAAYGKDSNWNDDNLGKFRTLPSRDNYGVEAGYVLSFLK